MNVAAENDFALFGLPVVFVIDLPLLMQRYRELQRAMHPDKFAQASEAERGLAVRQAARINDAYQHLKSPLARAQYLLTLFGHGIATENATLKDTHFLMEQMELHEALGEADATRLGQLQEQVGTQVQALLVELETGFAATAPVWHALQQTVLKLQFMHKLQREMEQRAERLLGI